MYCDMTHLCETWLIYVRRDSFVCAVTHLYVSWLIHMRRDSREIGMSLIAKSPVRHDSFMWDVTHLYVSWLIYMCRDSFIWDVTRERSYEVWHSSQIPCPFWKSHKSLLLSERVTNSLSFLRESQILPFQRVTNFVLKSPLSKSHEKSSFSKSHRSLLLSRSATHPDNLSELLSKRQNFLCKTATPKRFFPTIVTSYWLEEPHVFTIHHVLVNFWYAVATISRLLKIIRLFGEYRSLL